MAADEQLPTHSESIASGVQSIQREAKPEDSQALVPVFQNGGISQLPLSETLKDIGQIRGLIDNVTLKV